MGGFLKRAVTTGYGALRGLRNVTFALSLSGVAAVAEPVTVVALGDSLTAGYGLPPEEGLVPQLQAWLQAAGAEVVVQNAGVSGDTTAGGLSRLDWALGPEADALIVALGGNDMLRGLPPEEARANLAAILAKARGRGLPVLLVGMTAPANYGPDYKAAFDAIYPDLAVAEGALLLPDFFDGFRAAGADLTEPESFAAWMQADGIHPNAEGVALIVAVLGPKVLELLARAGG
ncbi:MAG: arylesterase [Fuscovulum sp.]|jgi:acyl-CoA thioesterase-1|nr:arylesterase [Fuscovulum sp.]